jgi:hypothetical protein
MVTAQNNAFFLDDEGNPQRLNTRGQYGFANFYKGRPELNGGVPFDYDWRRIDRPDTLRGDRGPAKNPFSRNKGNRADGSRDAVGPADGDRATTSPRHDLNGVTQREPEEAAGTYGMNWGYRGQGALPRGSQFGGQTPGIAAPALGPGPSRFPNAIETTGI